MLEDIVIYEGIFRLYTTKSDRKEICRKIAFVYNTVETILQNKKIPLKDINESIEILDKIHMKTRDSIDTTNYMNTIFGRSPLSSHGKSAVYL